MPGYSGGPVVTTLVCLLHISHARLRVHWAPGIPHALTGEGSMHDSDASRRGNVESCLLKTNAPRFQSSSPGLTGRPSIPETPVARLSYGAAIRIEQSGR